VSKNTSKREKRVTLLVKKVKKGRDYKSGLKKIKICVAQRKIGGKK